MKRARSKERSLKGRSQVSSGHTDSNPSHRPAVDVNKILTKQEQARVTKVQFAPCAPQDLE